MYLTTITAPTSEPLTREETKLFLRMDTDADDAFIVELIALARERVEEISWHALMTQTVEMVLMGWPDSPLKLLRPPLQSITSITYKDSEGIVTPWPEEEYVVSYGIPAILLPANETSWPGVALYPVDAIRIRYVCGYADAASIPRHLKHAMLLLVGYWYENREAVVMGSLAHEIEMGVDALCYNYRHRVMGQ